MKDTTDYKVTCYADAVYRSIFPLALAAQQEEVQGG